MLACHQVPMPAQYRVRPDQQPKPAEHVAWEPVQQGGQERPVGGAEAQPGLTQLPLQHYDLMALRTVTPHYDVR